MNTPIRLAARGKVVAVGPVTKAKKAGGTYTVYEASLDTGVVVDFGFSPPAGINVGDTIERAVVKDFGKYKDQGPLNGEQLPDAFPKRAAAPASTAGGAAVTPTNNSSVPTSYGKKFPVEREHGDTAIIRQNALTNAVKTVVDGRVFDSAGLSTPDELIDEIIRLAYRYAGFSSGQADATLIAKLGAEPK